MNFEDIREFVSFLEKRGQLRRIKKRVSRDLEITEINDRVIRSGGPALLFENVEGYDIPVLINIFGTHQRVAWALGVNHIDELVGRVRKLLGLVQGPPPSGLLNKVRALGDILGVARTQPRLVKSASCQEVVLTGEDADLDLLPALTCWPMDGGRYITLPLVITRDPETGRRNVGTYRMQIFDGRTTGMHWQTHKVGAHHYRVGEAKKAERLEVAVALGGDPATIWTGSMPLPPDMDELAVAGLIREEPVEVVKCKTVDLEVPAHAEFVLEGYVTPGELRPEGPFGDHTGYYSLAEEYPVFHLTAITHRRDPIYPTTVVGRPPTEDFYMGKASERLFLPALQMALPEVVDINMPAEGIFQNLVIVSIRKEYPGQARKVMHGLWGLGLLMLTKTIIVVDHYVDVQNLSEVAWRVTANLDPARDVVFAEGPADDLDHASHIPRFGSKMGIDATAKGRMDGRAREWPPDIIMSDEIKKLVDGRWREYGV
ncbi:MAG: menaquinone biosynthesis decarboxylase [Chloroflexi bacterium]|nr:menaquinone biosynthesis decarboxylase [Chloroflexota bacterium]